MSAPKPPGTMPSLSRLWLPVDASFYVDDNGLTWEPASFQELADNSTLRPIEAYKDWPVVVMLGEAGSGKSYELDKLANESRKDSRRVQFIDLADFGAATLLKSEIDSALAVGTDDATIYVFLDALDECRTTIDKAEALIARTLENHRPNRLFLRIACRSAVWPASFLERLQKHWGHTSAYPTVAVIEPAPLRSSDVRQAADAVLGEATPFMEALSASNAFGFALHPLGLKLLLESFAPHRALPKNRWDLYESALGRLCREPDPRKFESSKTTPLTEERRLDIAGRIGAFLLLTNRDGVWLGHPASAPSQSLQLTELTAQRKVATVRSTTESQFREVIASPLFSLHGHELVGFAHRSYAEFLAARFLSDGEVEQDALLQCLTNANEAKSPFAPQLYGLLEWLAEEDPRIVESVIALEPHLLLRNTMTFASDKMRSAAVDAVLLFLLSENTPELSRARKKDDSRFCHPHLSAQLLSPISDQRAPLSARIFAVELAGTCRVTAAFSALYDIALDATKPYELRIASAIAAMKVDRRHAIQCMLPLLNDPSDLDDNLRGALLMEAAGKEIPWSQVFPAMTRPRNEHDSGWYQMFLLQIQDEGIDASACGPAIRWLGELGDVDLASWRFRATAESVVQDLLVLLMEDKDQWDALGKAVWHLLELSHKLPEYSWRLNPGGKSEAQYNNIKREFIKAMVNTVPSGERYNMLWLESVVKLDVADFEWLCALYDAALRVETKEILAEVMAQFAWVSPTTIELDWLLDRGGAYTEHRDPLIAAAISPLIRVFELDDADTEAIRKSWQTRQKAKTRMAQEGHQSPEDVLKEALADLQDDRVSVWTTCVAALASFHNFQKDRYIWEDIEEADLWKKLPPSTQQQVLQEAESCLRSVPPSRDLFFEQGHVSIRELSLYPALILLWRRRRDALLKDDAALLLKCAPLFAGKSHVARTNTEQVEMFQYAMSVDPKLMESLAIRTVDKCLSQRGWPLPNFVGAVYSRQLGDELFKKVPNASVQGQERLLDFLLQQGHEGAMNFALSACGITDIVNPNCQGICAALLWRHAPSQLARQVWNALKSDSLAVTTALANLSNGLRGSPSLSFVRVEETLTEEIYEFLEAQEPEGPANDVSEVLAERNTPAAIRRACIDALKSWGTPDALAALTRIVGRNPDKDWLRVAARDAAEAVNHNSWQPATPKEIAKILDKSGRWIVRSEAELAHVVKIAMKEIAVRVHRAAEHSICKQFWNTSEFAWRPKGETELSDVLLYELRHVLHGRGQIIDREVEVRNNRASGIGERTDLLIQVAATQGGETQVLRHVIEVKGCWNRELFTAPETQLRDNYMRAYNASQGTYVVFWFICDRWDNDDQRKRKTIELVGGKELELFKSNLDATAARASSALLCISPCVLDATF